MSLVVRTVWFAWSTFVARPSRSADDPFGPVEQDPDAARDVACELTVSEAVCNPPEPDPFEPAPDVPAAPAGGGGVPGLGTLLVVVLVLALLLALAWLVVAVLRRRGAADADPDDDDLDLDLDERVERRQVDHARPPAIWREAAAEHRGAGRYRDAIRSEYRALVGDLARAGIVDEIPGRTSGEERIQVADLAPAVADDFDPAADLFDEAWFGRVEVGAADDDRFVAAAGSVLDAVLSGATVRRAADGS